MPNGYQFRLQSILDLVAVLVALALLFLFFFRKKSVKLLCIYVAVFLVFVGILLFDGFYSVPVAKGIAYALMFFMIASLVVVYQSDFKIMFFNLTKSAEKVGDDDLTDEDMRHAVDEIIKACQTMSKARTGALIVIAPTAVAPHILETGVEMNALVSSQLLESIFNTRAPVHDGAVIVRGNRVLAAGCFLPLSQSQNVSKNLGTRHRAGIGITEESDMLTIIVSEETGIISIAKRGELRRFVTPDRLRDILHDTLKISQPTRHRAL